MRRLIFGVIALASSGAADAATQSSGDDVAATIKAAFATIPAGINAHDPAKATALDADDIEVIEPGTPNLNGKKADSDGFSEAMKADPTWHVSLIRDTVDVASSKDMAIYRGVYNEDGTVKNVRVTHRTNVLAEFHKGPDGWKMTWYAISPMEKSHPR